MVTIRAEDTKHLSVLKACLVTKLESELDFFVTPAYPETLSAALQFCDSFKKELTHKESLLRAFDNHSLHMRQDVHEIDSINASILDELELQRATDRHCSLLVTADLPQYV